MELLVGLKSSTRGGSGCPCGVCASALLLWADAFGLASPASVNGLKDWLNSSAPVMGLLLFWMSTKALIKIFLAACVFFIRKDTHALGILAQP